MNLLNRKAARRYVLLRTAEMRKGWQAKRVSGEFLDSIEALLKLRIDKAIAAHPTVGKTVRFVI